MSDGKLIFDTKVNDSGLKKGMDKAKNTTEKTLDDIAKESGKTVNQIRSEVMKAAAQYEKDGLSRSEAIKKAYADIGYTVGGTTSKIYQMSSAFEATGAKMTKYITKPALTAAGALAGISLVKGFNRLKNIDTARAQLEGLGHSAKEVEAIMDSAMESVKGTAYGFDEAATAAASAVAAGIKPGKQLTRYLGLVGDAAAQSKLSFTEMGSIFNKVMASGRISMEEVNQLADQGIPIYKMLSEQLGVTQADVREMVSAGKVDSETFLKAIETNIGGAAKIMGEKSFTGALSNMGASLSRIGANFLDAGGKGGGFFSQLKPLMVDAMETMGKIEDKAADWGAAFGNAFSTIIKVIRAVPGPVLGIGTAMAVSAGPALKLTGIIIKSSSALKAFKLEQQGMSIISGIANGKLTMQQAIVGTLCNKVKAAGGAVKIFSKTGISRLTTKLARLNPMLKTTNTLYGANTSSLYAQTNGVKAAAKGVSFYVKTTAKSTATTVKDTAANALNAVSKSRVGMAAKGAATKILAFASAHKVAMMASLGLVGAIAALVIYMTKTGASAEDVANMITNFADKAASMITGFADALPGMIDAILPAITSMVESLVSTLPTLIPALIQAAIPLFLALVQALQEVIPQLAAELPKIVQAFTDALPVLIPALIQAAVTLFLALVQAIPQIVDALIKAMPDIIKAIVTGLLSGIGQIFNVGIQLLKQLWQGINSWGDNLKSRALSFAKSIPGKVKSGLGSLASIGLDWIKGLWNGIKSAKDWLIEKIKGLCSSAKDAIKDFFKIKSPSRVMAALGKYIPMGLGVGIASKTKALVATVKEQMQSLKDAYSFNGGNVAVTHDLGARFVKSETSTDGGNAPAPSNYTQNNYFYRPEESPIETARALKNQNTFGLAGGWA